MRRLLVVVLGLTLASSVLALPGVGGGRGLVRIQNALVEPEAGLTLSAHVFARHPTISTSGDKGWVGDLIAPEISYAPVATRFFGFELFGSWGGIFQNPRRPGEEGLESGTHDLKAGAKISISIVPVFKLGFAAEYPFAARDNARGWFDPNALPYCSGLGWNALTTFQFQEAVPSLPNLILNYGKKDCYDVYGAGVELMAEDFTLFLEVRSLQSKSTEGFEFGSIFDTDEGQLRLTPGVAFGLASMTVLKLGYTFSYGSEAPNELAVGLVMETPFFKRAPAEFGTIAGRVVDAGTGLPLAAKVAFPESPKLLPLEADATGVFEAKKVPAGVVVVEVSADGYHNQAFPVTVAGDVVAQQEFRLKPLVTYGVIAGTVKDAYTNQPLGATVEFPGTDVGSQSTDPSTGGFRVDRVPTKVYSVQASAEGFFKSSATVDVKEGEVANVAFALMPLTLRTTMTGRVSDKKTDEALTATVSFPGSNLADVQTDPGTGVFTAELPVGAYAVKVSSEGYIDQTAAIVLEKDKPLVKNFALVKEGMAITLRGVYFDFNKATIKPESHEALKEAAQILKDNPTIKVEIQGHTDSKGSDSYNLQLSDRRAQSVVTYLVQNFAIDAARLTSRGYGETKPVASNDTEEGRALNRRVEFVIAGQ